MILFWMRAFKKPNAEQDEALKQMYLTLTAENQKKLDRHYKAVIAGYLTIALLCLIVTVGLVSFYFVLGSYKSLGLIFDIIFIALSAYATYTSTSWFGAKAYQRILINVEYAQRLYATQDNSQPTDSQIVNQIVEQEKQEESVEETGKTEQKQEQDDQTK